MVAWTDNENWGIPMQREYCGHISDRFIPCAHRRPCPIHDLPQGGSPEEPGRFPGTPAPPLFDSTEAK